jgi:hypothetical protein
MTAAIREAGRRNRQALVPRGVLSDFEFADKSVRQGTQVFRRSRLPSPADRVRES